MTTVRQGRPDPLAALPPLEPDPLRGAIIRERCRRRLTRRRDRTRRAAALADIFRRTLVPAFGMGLGLLYVLELIGAAWRSPVA